MKLFYTIFNACALATISFQATTFCMPYMLSDEPDIRLASAFTQIERLFERLLFVNQRQANNVLNYCIANLSDFSHQHRIGSPQRYRRLRRSHLQECNAAISEDAPDPFILQTLLSDHLELTMSIKSQNRMIMSLMLSVYMEDIEYLSDMPWTDDETAKLLYKHAKIKGYLPWQHFLRFMEEEEGNERE